ncbi:MAG: sel1 repeat family protein [Planctomycetota bacterium]|jgi:TPR repeat protein|nr:sel1 repeat family protein [Planctomycetota bacterium]
MKTAWQGFFAIFAAAILPFSLPAGGGEPVRPAATLPNPALGQTRTGESPGAAGDQASGRVQPPQTLSPAEAFAAISTEAEKGVPTAMLTLGTMYERGIGTPRNFIKALEWYRKAAEAGLAEGYYNVGVCHEIGMGTAGGQEEAFIKFEKSAELGLAQGLYKLASLYFLGFGTAKNEQWGVELLKRATAAGHMVAANDLGVIHFSGDFGQAKNSELAFDMFTRAAQLGNAEAMKNLAVFYRDGLGGRAADPVQELKWYLLSRRAGFPPAALDKTIEDLRARIGPDRATSVDAEVESWIADFRARQPQPPATP